MRLLNSVVLKNIRKKLRNNMSKPEQKLWYFLRNRQLKNTKFRRQVSIGRYVVDFFSFEKKLVIEVDGNSHFLNEQAIKNDLARTNFLKENGFTVLRFTNDEVMNNAEACAEKIMKYL